MLLLLPVALFFLNLPNDGFSAGYQKTIDTSKFDFADGNKLEGPATGVDFNVGFLELERAALSSDQRKFYSGKQVRLSGRYAAIAENRFTLVRYKINCCAADATPLRAVIIVTPTPGQTLNVNKVRGQWVSVTGRIHFIKKGNGSFDPALIVTPSSSQPIDELVKVIPVDPHPYIY